MEVCILKQIFSVFLYLNPPPTQFSQLLFRFYVIICLLVPSSLLPWNPSVFLAVSCTWSNMTRAREPIHFHLVIYRRFDLPQCSFISIRGGLLAGKTSRVYVWCACMCVSLCGLRLSYPVPHRTLLPSTCHPPVNTKAIVMVRIWRTSPIYLNNDNYCALEMGNGRLQQPISDVAFLIIDEMVWLVFL